MAETASIDVTELDHAYATIMQTIAVSYTHLTLPTTPYV